MASKKEFVNLETFIPGIVLDIVYATTNNFVKRKVYPSSTCLLRRGTAEKLAKVQDELKKRRLALKVFDGYRPVSVQKIFWDFLPDDRYVANPAEGSKHNRGAAVDVTIIDEQGNEFSMPTPFDSFSELAHRTCQDLPKEILANRNLLEQVMHQQGFIGLPTEWWHFDDTEWKEYPIEEISL